MGDPESGFRELSIDLQEEEDKNNQQYTSVVMEIEVDRRLPSRNVVASDDGGGEDTPTVTSSG